jgi:hypothetical protein
MHLFLDPTRVQMEEELQRPCHAAKREGHHERKAGRAGFLARPKWGHSPFPSKRGQSWALALITGAQAAL